MTEGMTCYERDEITCEDQMCLRVGCKLRNERLAPTPFAWTIPGDDTADVHGFIPCHVTNHGEFTKPLYAAPSAVVPDSADPLDNLVARFAKRLLAKLKLARANGRSGWELDDWEADCQRGLLRHLGKGDPRDVAAYCAFMDHHGWITKAPPDSAEIEQQTIERCAKHLENEADIATNSLHCGDNSQTIAATHLVSRAYHEAAKAIRALSPSPDGSAHTRPSSKTEAT